MQPADFRDTKYKQSRAALIRYKELHGDLTVPSTFVVPHSPDWPQVRGLSRPYLNPI